MGAVNVIRKFRLLKDVTFGTPSDGDVPTYDAGTDKLVMSAPAAGGGPPTGPAGGDLSGTYPNPDIAAGAIGTTELANDAVTAAKIAAGAVGSSEIADGSVTPTDLSFDPATQAELDALAATAAAGDAAVQANLDAHIGDPVDAHDASAISNVPAGGVAASTVQAAINELDTEKAASVHTHAGEDITSGTVADARIAATIARDSEVSAAVAASEAGQVRDGDAAGGVLSGTYPNPGFAADMATQAELDAHVNDASDAHDASAVSFAPAGSIAATDVQAAIEEVAAEAGGAPATADYLVGTAQGGLSAEIVVGTSPGGELGGTWAAPTVDAVHSGSSHAAVQAAAEATAAAALQAHLDDATDPHDAAAISIADAGGDFTATDVEGALAELQADHETDEAALAAHLADTADAHDASAISFAAAGSIAATDVQAAIEEVAAEASGGTSPNDANLILHMEVLA